MKLFPRLCLGSVIAILLLLLVLPLTPIVAQRPDSPRGSFGSLWVSQLQVGPTATKLQRVTAGSLTIASGATSGTLTLSGVTATDLVTATITSGNSSSRHVVRATPGTGSVSVLLSGTPGSSTTVSVIAIRTAE